MILRIASASTCFCARLTRYLHHLLEWSLDGEQRSKCWGPSSHCGWGQESSPSAAVWAAVPRLDSNLIRRSATEENFQLPIPARGIFLALKAVYTPKLSQTTQACNNGHPSDLRWDFGRWRWALFLEQCLEGQAVQTYDYENICSSHVFSFPCTCHKCLHTQRKQVLALCQALWPKRRPCKRLRWGAADGGGANTFVRHVVSGLPHLRPIQTWSHLLYLSRMNTDPYNWFWCTPLVDASNPAVALKLTTASTKSPHF